VLLLAGCCESKWCAFDSELNSLSPQEAEAKVSSLSDEELLDFHAWQVVKSHPSSARFRGSVIERGEKIVPAIVDRLEGGTGLVEMDLMDLLLDINRTSGLEITDEQRASVIERCLAMYVQNPVRCAAFEKG
jgi:hypothetical protein